MSLGQTVKREFPTKKITISYNELYTLRGKDDILESFVGLENRGKGKRLPIQIPSFNKIWSFGPRLLE